MPVKSRTVTTGTTRVKISTDNLYYRCVHLQSGTPIADIYVGGPDVTVANGIRLTTATNTLEFQLGSDDQLWAVANQANAVIRILEIT
jgi:hypothetical protein